MTKGRFLVLSVLPVSVDWRVKFRRVSQQLNYVTEWLTGVALQGQLLLDDGDHVVTAQVSPARLSTNSISALQSATLRHFN